MVIHTVTVACNCRDAINDELAKHGGELLASLFCDPPRLFVATTHRMDVKRKKKLPLVVATFCPFCGVRIPEDTGPLSKLQDASQFSSDEN